MKHNMETELANRVMEYLLQEVNKTNWTFFSLPKVQKEFKGIDIRDALNELSRNGYIRKREGMNNVLIEVVRD